MTERALETPKLRFNSERIEAVWPDASALMPHNGEETGLFESEGFKPDFKRYSDLYNAGFLRVFTARRGEELLGYSIFCVSAHLHYPTKLVALQDVIYVRPENRGFVAVKFLMWCDQTLKAEGVNAIIRQVTRKRDFTNTLVSMGYEPFESTYLRRF